MTAAWSFLCSAFDVVLVRSLEIVLLVVVVALVERGLARRLTPRWSYALWLLVPLRLVLPFAPEAPWSVYGLVASADVASAPPATAPVEPPPDLDAFTLRASTAPTRRAEPVEGSEPPRKDALRATPRIDTGHTGAAIPAHSSGAEFAAAEPPGSDWRRIGALVWCAGLLVSLAIAFTREHRFARALRRLPTSDDPRLAALLAAALAESRVRRGVALVVTDLVRTPAVHGVLRPRVLIPPSALDRLSSDEISFVLRHELAHVRCHDAVANWMLALLGAVFWFHPVVRWALSRLVTHRESARDWMALEGTSGASPADYGRTLLHLLESAGPKRHAPATALLLEHHGDLRRRITMLTRYRPSTRRGLVLGALALGLLSTVTLTRAPLQEVRAEDPVVGAKRPAAAELARVHVVRQRREPAWETRLRAKLDEKLAFDLKGSLADLVADLRGRAGINVVVDPALIGDLPAVPVTLRSESSSVESMLRWALDPHGLDYSLADGAVFIGSRGALPRATERRYYDVRPLLDGLRRTSAEQGADVLGDLVRSVIDPHAWELEGASMESWKGLLIVDQTPRVHDGVEGFLNLLLNRGRRPEQGVPEWRPRLDAALAKPVSVSYENASLEEVAADLGNRLGAPVLTTPDLATDRALTFSLKDVPARDALAWVARLAEVEVAVAEGSVRLTETPPTVCRCYPLGDLLDGPLDDGEADLDVVQDMIRSSTSWWQGGAQDTSLYVWDDLLVVTHTEAVHGEIEEVLSALRRVFAK